MTAPGSTPDLQQLREIDRRTRRPSLTGQTVDQLGGRASLLVRQRRDHAELDRLLQVVADSRGSEQDAALTRLGRLVFPHAYAEETVVWPVLRAVLSDGEELTERNEQEHQDVNELWSELDRTPPGSPRRDELVSRIGALLSADARDEEDVLLPRLQDALTPGQLRRLGRTWQLVRWTAPTRPHARVSRRPPGNVLSGLPLAVLDRSRDGLDRTARRAPALSGVCTGASRVLAAVAGAVEHLPPLQRGERASTRPGRTEAAVAGAGRRAT